jgi:hypothetical protein
LTDVKDDANVVAVVAVGSAVRPGVRSVDLDLVVICKRPEDLRVRAPLEIDLRSYPLEHVLGQLAGGNDLLGWAVKFGKVLFQRNGYWDSLSDSWHDRLPLPAPDVAAQRADESFHRLTKVLELGDVRAAEEQAVSYATHLARAELLRRNVYPASRPELPAQLRKVGSYEAADCLEQLFNPAVDHSRQIRLLAETRRLTGGRNRPPGLTNRSPSS